MQAEHDSANSALAVLAQAQAQEAHVCYICREEDCADPVVQVCGCVGETGFAHVACAVSWLEARGGEPTSQCAFCHRQYGLREEGRRIDYTTLACRIVFYMLLACNMHTFGHNIAGMNLSALVHVYQCSSQVRQLFRLTVGSGKTNHIESMMRSQEAYTWTVYQRAAMFSFCALLCVSASLFFKYTLAWFPSNLQQEITWAFYYLYLSALTFNTGNLPFCCLVFFIVHEAVMDAHEDFPWIRKHELQCSDGTVYLVPTGGAVQRT